jgi:hypothetical protein
MMNELLPLASNLSPARSCLTIIGNSAGKLYTIRLENRSSMAGIHASSQYGFRGVYLALSTIGRPHTTRTVF